MSKHISVSSSQRTQFIDITQKVKGAIRETGVKNGVCFLYVPHTTAAITINEGADPSVKHDILTTLNRLVPSDASYTHREGNADSHVKSSLIGSSVNIFIEDGSIRLGTWQAVFFCEFDGPRSRRVEVKVIKE